jgi:hypothetical protein
MNDTQSIIDELTARLHERTQGFLENERILRNELNVLKEILTGTVYSEVTNDAVTYSITSGQMVGRHDHHQWDQSLPFRGQVNIVNGRPQYELPRTTIPA